MITGIVYNYTTKQPLEGIEVYLSDAGGNKTIGAEVVKTTANGRFYINKYGLFVTAEGENFAKKTMPVSVNIPVELPLTPENRFLESMLQVDYFLLAALAVVGAVLGKTVYHSFINNRKK